ncbi:MAG: carbohydrate-binding family 9-like protein, partial [Candidatus Cryptobacteroides sp.]
MENNVTLRIPRVEGLGGCKDINEFHAALEAGVKGSLDCVNWPEWPEKPSCKFSSGWCREGIGILFDVEGRDLRAQAIEDNGKVWEDSCCEFFIADPEDGTYYNFELNCIGTLLAA